MIGSYLLLQATSDTIGMKRMKHESSDSNLFLKQGLQEEKLEILLSYDVNNHI